MDKKIFALLLCTFFITFCIHAQKADPVVIKINGDPILRSELEQAYKKSNALREQGDKESIVDFTQSYVDFKLNVREAKAQRLDTIGSYIRDLSSARVQLAYKYMQDTIQENKYLQKIYNRMHEEVEINHILLPFDKKTVFPSDTISLYNKALDLRKKLMKEGFKAEGYEKPEALATSVMIDNEQRNGYIGWVIPFMFSAKIEDVIYSLALNEVSQPIKTQKGYHIIQVLNRRPARGSVELEQVIFSFPNLPPTQHQIDSVGKVAKREYANIRSSRDFESLCKEFSLVHNTGDKGCYFGIVGLESILPPSYISAVMNIDKVGDVSKPILTDYGYHIVRLLNKIPVPDFSLIKESLKAKVLKGSRAQDMTEAKRNEMMNVFSLDINSDAYNQINKIANNVSPQDSEFLGLIRNGEDILFKIDDKEVFKVKDFAKYIQFRQNSSQDKEGDAPDMFRYVDVIKYAVTTDLLKEYFDSFLSYNLSNYYYSTLEDRYPEFNKQMEEFSEGLLSFAVKNKNIWERSTTDEAGLADYFNKNKVKYALDGPRYKGVIVYAKNEAVLKKAEALAKKEKDQTSLIQKLRDSLNRDSIAVQMESGLWVKGQNPFVDNKIFGGSQPSLKKNYPSFFVTGKLINAPQDFTDVRNAVEFDYQNKLEQDWAADLRNKYKVEIDESVLNTIR